MLLFNLLQMMKTYLFNFKKNKKLYLKLLLISICHIIGAPFIFIYNQFRHEDTQNSKMESNTTINKKEVNDVVADIENKVNNVDKSQILSNKIIAFNEKENVVNDTIKCKTNNEILKDESKKDSIRIISVPNLINSDVKPFDVELEDISKGIINVDKLKNSYIKAFKYVNENVELIKEKIVTATYNDLYIYEQSIKELKEEMENIEKELKLYEIEIKFDYYDIDLIKKQIEDAKELIESKKDELYIKKADKPEIKKSKKEKIEVVDEKQIAIKTINENIKKLLVLNIKYKKIKKGLHYYLKKISTIAINNSINNKLDTELDLLVNNIIINNSINTMLTMVNKKNLFQYKNSIDYDDPNELFIINTEGLIKIGKLKEEMYFLYKNRMNDKGIIDLFRDLYCIENRLYMIQKKMIDKNYTNGKQKVKKMTI